MSLNEDLQEIKNTEFVTKLKKDFLGNYSKFYSMSPVICGTIVNRGIGQPQFDRKLKMINAPIYALLQLMQSREFVQNKEQADVIKQAVSSFLRTEAYHLLDRLDINEKLEGWEKLLQYRCL